MFPYKQTTERSSRSWEVYSIYLEHRQQDKN